MTAAEIAAVLGAAHRLGRWWSCRCPAHDDRTPSLSLCDGDRGLIVRCWAGCDPRDVLAELRCRRLLDCVGAAPFTNERPDDRRNYERRIEIARRLWAEAWDPRGTAVEHYLAARGITIPVPPSLRWVDALRRPDGTHAPAMIARVDGLHDHPIAVHRTWLTRGDRGQWHRHDRKSLGPLAGGAVRLGPTSETLLVAEGIETALAAMQATAMPGWAALSTSGMVALALPACVQEVVILADHDRSGAGQRAAHTAARRWLQEGRRVRIALPPEPGADFNDVLLGRSQQRGRAHVA
jgi:hypothetical protein